jgi:hypothetical protein
VGIGVAVGTLLLALALGGLHGWDAREARTGWRADLGYGGPRRDTRAAAPAVLAAGRTEHAAGTAGRGRRAGGDRSGRRPAARSRARARTGRGVGVTGAGRAARPAARRPPGRPVPRRAAGPIGDAGLRGPDELVAIVGRAPGDPALAGATALDGYGPVGDFGTIEVYRQLTFVAAALLVFPVASLLGASARLTAARRTQRLALLRLLGASTRQVTVAATTEVTVGGRPRRRGRRRAVLAGRAARRAPRAGGGRWFADDVRPLRRCWWGSSRGWRCWPSAPRSGACAGGGRPARGGPPAGDGRRPAGAAARRRRGLAVFAGVNAALQGGTAADVTGWCSASACWRCSARCR